MLLVLQISPQKETPDCQHYNCRSDHDEDHYATRLLLHAVVTAIQLVAFLALGAGC